MSKNKAKEALREAEMVAQTEEMLQVAQEELEKLEQARENVMSSIARSISEKLAQRMSRRKNKEAQWLQSTRDYLGSMANRIAIATADEFFENDKISGRRPEHNITKSKCRIAIGQCTAYQFAAGDKNWSIRAPARVSPSDFDQTDLQNYMQANTHNGQQPPPPSPTQVVQFKASLMSQAIEAYLTSANYGPECRRAIFNRVVLGTGILKGPRSVSEMKRVYEKARASNGSIQRIPRYINERKPCVSSVNPWFFFPDDLNLSNPKQREGDIQIHMWTPSEMRKYLKHDGFLKDQLAKVLEGPPAEVAGSPFDDPAWLTEGVSCAKGKYIVAEYHGPINMSELDYLGISPVIEPDENVEDIYCEAWSVNDRLIRLEIARPDGAYCSPYHMCPWEPDPGSPFGFGLPMEVTDQQRSVNETYKMLLDNAGCSAGPMMIIDTSVVKPVDGSMSVEPFKVFYSEDTYGKDLDKAIVFQNIPNNFDGLAAFLNMTKGMADEQASIPAILAGIGSPTGAGDSATQMAILNQNAQSPIFLKSEEWDDDMTAPFIKGMYEWVMENDPDDSIKGTYDIDVRTSTAYLRNTMQQQKLERLSMEASQGSPIAEYINMDELIIARLAGADTPYAGIVKSPEQVLQERANRPPPPPDPNMLKAQAAMQKVELDKQRLEFDRMKVEQEAQLKMQLAQMDMQAQHEENQVRLAEAASREKAAFYQYQAQMAALAAKDEQAYAKMQLEADKARLTSDTQKYTKGMDIPLKLRDQDLKEQEMRLKASTGSGV
jgi:hypothetical protein